MNRIVLLAIVFTLSALAGNQDAKAQFGPVVWQQPAPVIWQQPAQVVWQQPAPVVWQQPAPVFLPTQTTLGSPVIVQRPATVVSSVPVTRVYRAPVVVYQPTREIVTRQRPILGGSVSRTRYGYRRVVF